jgi:hypothetical protein
LHPKLLPFRADQAYLRRSDLLINSLFALDWKSLFKRHAASAIHCNLTVEAERVNRPIVNALVFPDCHLNNLDKPAGYR